MTDITLIQPSLKKLIKTKATDNRLFLTLDILGTRVQGLLDSGAHRTVLGTPGLAKLTAIGLKPKQLASHIAIKFANTTSDVVTEAMDIPMSLNGKLKVVEALVCASVDQPLTLGMDFWRAFELIPEIVTGSIDVSTVMLAEIQTIQSGSHIPQHGYGSLMARVSKHFDEMGSKLGCTDRISHRIDTGQSKPIKQRYYRVSPYKQKAINEELDKMLKLGVVEASTSAWSSPVLLLDKRDGSRRFVVDFRKVNEVTQRDAFPMPYIADILDRLRDAKFLTSLDLKSAYWQVKLEESSKEKTAFTIPGRGLYQFTVMPFGLHNSSSTWMRLVSTVIGADLEPNVFVYLDDIIIVTATFEEHLRVVDEVFNRLKAAGLTLNEEKCQFCRKELKYLGYVVDEHGLHVDPAKIEAILQYPRPRDVKELRRFIGMTSWYRRFVPSFSSIIAPINDLTKKNQKFTWTEETEAAFQLLKEKLVTAPVMTCPDFNKPFTLQTDASSFGVGWVLAQGSEDTGEQVIAYGSRSLSKQERKMSATERECLAVITAIEANRPYLEGADNFTVVTDHHSLLWLHNLKDPTGRLSRWALRLQPYRFNIVHRKGKEHHGPDALSRAVADNSSDQSHDESEVNFNLITIPNPVRDRWYIKMVKSVKEKPLHHPQWRIDGEVLYKKTGDWHLVVPKEARPAVYEECHAHPTAGHLGIFKTYQRIAQVYYWPKMRHDVTQYVNRCATCLQYKPEQKAPAGLMGRQKDVCRPWQLISTDIMGPMPRSPRGSKYLLVVADWFTKFALLFPLRTATASKIVQHIENDVIKMFGAPQTIICDNGSQYAGKALRQLAAKYESRVFFNARYHPQVNPTERINRVLKTMIASYVTDKHTEWDKHLSDIGFALRTAKHEVTGRTPVFLNFGREIYLSGKMHGKPDDGDAVPRCDRDGVGTPQDLTDIYADVKKRMKTAYENSAQRYNLRRRPLQFNVGQHVYKRNFVLSDAGKKFTAKLAPKYVGPFLIKRKLSPLVYELENARKKSIGHWHVTDLKPTPQGDD